MPLDNQNVHYVPAGARLEPRWHWPEAAGDFKVTGCVFAFLLPLAVLALPCPFFAGFEVHLALGAALALFASTWFHRNSVPTIFAKGVLGLTVVLATVSLAGWVGVSGLIGWVLVAIGAFFLVENAIEVASRVRHHKVGWQLRRGLFGSGAVVLFCLFGAWQRSLLSEGVAAVVAAATSISIGLAMLTLARRPQ